MQPLVEHDLARNGIVANDERLGIVEQDLARHPAKVAEGPLQAFEPSRLPLVLKRGHETAARASESRHEQVDPYPLAGDRHQGRAEVDLQLSAGWRLEAHAARPGKQITSQISHRPLDRAQMTRTPCSRANSWRTTSALPRCWRNRSASQPSNPASADGRPRPRYDARPPCRRYRFTVVRLHPNSAAIRFDPQPSSASRSITATSSGVSIRSSPAVVAGERESPVRNISRSFVEGGSVFMSPGGQFVVSPDNARAAELSPDDPWTWIGLSLLETGNQASEHAIREAERAARNAHDARAQIVALQSAGVFDAENGDQSRAEQALNQALSRAQQWVSEEPADPTAWRYLALSFMRLGDYLLQTGRRDPAAAAYSQALAVRQRLAATDPTSQPRMLDVVASHLLLWAAAEASGDKAAADIHRSEANRIYRSLLSGDAFKPIITLHSGAATSVLLAAGGLTLLVGLIGLAQYRRTLARYMRAAASTRRTTQNAEGPRSTVVSLESEIALLPIDADKRVFGSAGVSPAVAYSRRAFRLASWVYGVAGGAFGAAAAGVFLSAISVVGATWYQILTQTLCWSWPVILTLALLWGPDRKRLWFLVAAYLSLLLPLCIRANFSESPPPVEFGITIPRFFVPIIIWIIIASDTLFLLLILNRRLRAVGPVLFIFMLVVAVGGFAGLAGIEHLCWHERPKSDLE